MIIDWLKGKKTYIIALLMAITTFTFQLGWIDRQTYELIMGLLGAGGFAALRAGINKMGGDTN